MVIFVKSVQRCMALSTLLGEQNFPAIAIHRSMTQEERLSRYQQFKDFKKVLVCYNELFDLNVTFLFGIVPNRSLFSFFFFII